MHDRLIMYDSLQCSFLKIKKPPAKKSSCPVCGPNPSIKTIEDSISSSQLARGPAGFPVKEDQSPQLTVIPDVPPHLDISCKDFDKLRKDGLTPHILLDVRVPRQFEICAMDDSINIPLGELESRMEEVKSLSDNWNKNVFCICRRGIASAEATRIINETITSEKGKKSVFNVRGGLNSWVKEVDANIPMY